MVLNVTLIITKYVELVQGREYNTPRGYMWSRGVPPWIYLLVALSMQQKVGRRSQR